MFLWNHYKKKCEEGVRFYQYSQYCELYNKWCEENYETANFDAVIAPKMEVDFAGQAFSMVDPLTGEIMTIVVFVAILSDSQYIYAEGMLSTKESQWIGVLELLWGSSATTPIADFYHRLTACPSYSKRHLPFLTDAFGDFINN